MFCVEKEAKTWRDTNMTRKGADKDEENWADGESGTAFVKPNTTDGQLRWEYLKGGDLDGTNFGWMSEQMDGDATIRGSSSKDTLSRDLERISLGSLGKWTWDIHSIILDLSTANFIDTVAAKTITNVSVK